jgi:DNA modification methylase
MGIKGEGMIIIGDTSKAHITILTGDVVERLRELPSQSINCVVTSPPYFNQRDYGVAGQIGLEKTLDEYIEKLVAVFTEVWRVLRDDGVMWLNIGDSYANNSKWGGSTGGKHVGVLHGNTSIGRGKRHTGLKPKDLMGVPWHLAFALQSAGWYLRQDVIWHKTNPMPESTQDRCTKAHEYLFMLTKSPRYFYNAGAIRTPPSDSLIKQVMDGYDGAATKDYDSAGAQDPSAVKSRIIEQLRKRINAGSKTPDGWDTTTGEGGHGDFHKAGREKGEKGKPRQDKQRGHSRPHTGFNDRWDLLSKEDQQLLGANKRDVWEAGCPIQETDHYHLLTNLLLAAEAERIGTADLANLIIDLFSEGDATSVWKLATRPYKAAHFATFPPDLIRPCVRSSCQPNGVVLDPFFGSGTTGQVVLEEGLGRSCIGIELKPDYIELAYNRCFKAWVESLQ